MSPLITKNKKNSLHINMQGSFTIFKTKDQLLATEHSRNISGEITN